MTRTLLLTLMLTACFSLSSVAQTDSLKIRVAGIIASSDTSLQAPFVHVINLRTGRGVISDTAGVFKTSALKSDTLLFRCIGFEDQFFTIPDTLLSTICLLSIDLSPTTYHLQVVDVYALSRINQFRHDFINFEYSDYQWRKELIIPGVTKGEYKLIKEDERPLILAPASPISALYNMFSKKVASQKKLIQLLEEEKTQVLANEKFNINLLKEFTQYPPKKNEEFFYFLNYSKSYLLSTNSYDIFDAVYRSMPQFEKQYMEDSLK